MSWNLMHGLDIVSLNPSGSYWKTPTDVDAFVFSFSIMLLLLLLSMILLHVYGEKL